MSLPYVLQAKQKQKEGATEEKDEDKKIWSNPKASAQMRNMNVYLMGDLRLSPLSPNQRITRVNQGNDPAVWPG